MRIARVEIRTVESVLAIDDSWWRSLSKKEKQEYIQEHPDSKYALRNQTGVENPVVDKIHDTNIAVHSDLVRERNPDVTHEDLKYFLKNADKLSEEQAEKIFKFLRGVIHAACHLTLTQAVTGMGISKKAIKKISDLYLPSALTVDLTKSPDYISDVKRFVQKAVYFLKNNADLVVQIIKKPKKKEKPK